MNGIKIIIFILVTAFASQGWAQHADATSAISYMSYLSSKVVQRPLNTNEISMLTNQGPDAFGPIVDGWTSDPKFLDSAQQYVEMLLSTSGNLGGVDYGLPGYLGRDIARRSRPYADLLTANSCVNLNGQNIACDTGAPYTAGVLTTKAYMLRTVGAYNISRAGKMTSKFLCTTYPFPEAEEPKIASAELVDEFATQSGSISFGNGNNCYSCHSQFGHHTQFFVKFDINGNYRAAASGLQAPGATDGFSQDGLLTSHFRSAGRAGQENSQILGQPAANLASAAQVIVRNHRFLPCAVQNMMRHFYRLSDQNIQSIKPDLYQVIGLEAQRLSSQPSFSHILRAIITNENVYNSFKNTGARP